MEQWNYKMPDRYDKGMQMNWNQTLTTAFNRTAEDTVPPVFVYCPYRFKPLIETLVFYKENRIGDNYFVIFVEADSNLIKIGESHLEILNFDPPQTYKKPPIGLMPRDIHNRSIKVERFYQVCGAISRYYGESLKIPIAWIEEYNELVDDIKDITDVYEKET